MTRRLASQIGEHHDGAHLELIQQFQDLAVCLAAVVGDQDGLVALAPTTVDVVCAAAWGCSGAAHSPRLPTESHKGRRNAGPTRQPFIEQERMQVVVLES